MKLLKIGDQFINIDMLESVNMNGEFLTLSIAGDQYLFAGEEACALRKWFNQYAFDLMKHEALSVDRMTQHEPSIDQLNAQVRALGLFRKPFVLK